jgi:hypothetical protein
MGSMMDRKTKLMIKGIKDPKLKAELKKLYLKKAELLKRKEDEKINEKEMHNKYLPKYLSPKILNAIGFIQFTKQKGELDMPGMTKFLVEEKKFSQKEIGWILLLLSFETIEEILSTPEVSSLLKTAINKTRTTLH